MIDGEIGIWPFVFQERAKRSSCNRLAGTLETMIIPRIDRENIIPAIKAKWPIGSKRVIIQQDNAGPHAKAYDPEIAAVCADERIDICLPFQPPNSPDFNVLDLGFFNSIQALQHHNAPRTIDDLIKCTVDAFAEVELDTLNDTFLSVRNAWRVQLRWE